MTCERLFYSITRIVTEVAEKSHHPPTENYRAYIGRTEYRDVETKLVLKDFKVRYSTADKGKDALVENLRHFNINSQEETVFEVVYRNGKRITQESDYATLQLTKF